MWCVFYMYVCIYIYTYWLSYLYIFNCDSYDMIVVWYSKSNYISGSGVYPEVDATADWGCGTALCAPAGRKVLMVRICSYQPWGFRHDFAHATVVSASNLKSLGGWRVCCQGESSIGAAVSIGCRRGGGCFCDGLMMMMLVVMSWLWKSMEIRQKTHSAGPLPLGRLEGKASSMLLMYRNQPNNKNHGCHQSHKKKSKLSVFFEEPPKKKGTPTNLGVLKLTGTKAPRNPPKGPTHHQEEEAILPPPAPHAVPRPAPAATERVITVGSVPWQQNLFLLNENPNLGLMTFIVFFWCRYW